MINRKTKFLIAILLLVTFSGTSSAATFTVDPSGGADYTKIQDAINSAAAGDTINVSSGTYYENVNVNKQLFLHGMDTGNGIPIVDGGWNTDVLILSADSVTLDNFTFINARYSGLKITSHNNTISRVNASSNNYYGIYVYYSNNNSITNVIANSNSEGIYLENSGNNELSDIDANNNYDAGIFVESSINNKITNINASNNNYYGLYAYNIQNNDFTGINASNNNYYGLYLDYSKNNNLTDIISNSNYYGIYLDYDSNNNKLSNINASNNNYYGLYLYYSQNNNLTGIITSDNRYKGLYLRSSNYNEISEIKVFNSSEEGVYIYFSDYNNLSGISSYNNYYGFYVRGSNYNNITGNTINNNSNTGIFLKDSSQNYLRNNTLAGNNYNFYLNGYQDYHYNNTIEQSNTVDGKPVYYLKDEVDTYYGVSSNAGLFYCIRCNNVTISNAFLSKNYYGIFFWNTYNSSLLNIDSSNNYYGIYFSASSNNNISGSTISYNNEGIYFDSSGNNRISSNNVFNNSNNGVQLLYSDNNEFNKNVVVGNSNLDFNVYGTVNTGDNNTCDRPDGWNDNGTIGCRYLSMPIGNYPDFVVTNLEFTPAIFNLSDPVTINVTIMNVGAYFSGDISAGLYVDGEYVAEGSTYASLETFQETYIESIWYVDRYGYGRILTAKADFNNHRAEQDESNNSLDVTLPYIGAPDLVVENITWLPNPYSVGNTVNFQATIKNIGDAPMPYSSIYVRYFVDDNWLYFQTWYGYWYKYDGYWSGSLAPNESFIITSPSWYASPGLHSVKAFVDISGYIQESNETNNELNITLPEAKMADLIVQNITWSPDPFSAGQPVTFTATVKNIGNGTSPTTNNYVGFYLDGKIFTTSYSWYGSLAPNATYDFTGSWAAALPGNHTIKASADYYANVAESNETNNDLNVSLPYIPGPDLIVENITWLPSPYNAGQSVTFTAKIKNIGEASSLNTNHYVRFFIDGNYIAEPSWSGSLAPGANVTITSSSWTALPGNHTITAHVDYYTDSYYNRIKETNETNNNLSIGLPFTPGPDLVIDSITWSPVDFTAGQTVTFTANIRNAGNLPTNTAFYTLFRLDSSPLDTYGYGVYYSPVIQPGATVSVSQTWNTAQGGDHTLQVTADNSYYYPNRVPEINETNNGITIMLPYIELPDMIITDLTWTPYNYSAGDTILLNATIKNNGSGAWNGPVYVDFYYKNTTSISYNNPPMSLPPGGVGYATITWNKAQAGDFYLRAIVDRYDYYRPSIIESNEFNNEFYVQSNNVLMPDLIVESINLTVDHKLILRGDQNDNVYWKYFNSSPASGWQNPSFDDSLWSTGKTPFNKYGTRTALDLMGGFGYFRKIFNQTQGDNYTLNIASQDGVDAWINGVQVLAASSDTHYQSYWNYQVDISPYIQNGENVIAIRLKGNIDYWGNSYNYIDAQIAGITTSSPGSAKIDAGDIVTINASIKNIGRGSLSSWNIPIYFSIDDSGIGTPYKTLELISNGSDIISQPWTATSGNHSLKVMADSYDIYGNGYVDEVNESNNSITVNLPEIPKPDLIVEDIYWSPQDYIAGQTVTLYAILKNVGPGYVSNGFYSSIQIDNSIIGYPYYSGGIIPPGKIAIVSYSWSGQGGSHTIKIRADTGCGTYCSSPSVPEINESNNELTKNLTPILYPDIIITNVTATRAGVTTNISDLNASDGESIIFNATIMNLGPGDISATNLNVGFYINDTLETYGSKNQALPAGGIANVVSYTWLAKPGIHTFLARADHTYAIQEASENNNEYSSVLNPVLYSDLIVSNISWSPSNLSDGQSVIFNATIQNIGAGNTSRGISTRFFIDGAYMGEQYIYGGLGSGNSTMVSQSWIAVYGRQKVTAIVDYNDNIKESNESNNSFSSNLSFLFDEYPPQIISIHIEPANFTEHTINPAFFVQATDIGYGIDDSRIYLNYSVGNVSSLKPASFVSGNSYKAILTSFDLYLDAHQGETLAYNFIVYDRGENRVESNMSYEYIDIINDVPSITIQSPTLASRWKGAHLINWTVNNDNEGPTNSTLYYWKPAPWAPSYLENKTNYFKQGEWVLISRSTQTGMDSFLWDTTGWSGYTRIKVEATDGTSTVSEHSNDFVIDNEGVLIELRNYMAGGAYLTTRNPTIRGVVEGTFTNIEQISINSSDFNLTVSPVSMLKGDFEFSSEVNYSGTYSLNITATDEAGNTGYLDALFLVDPELPVIQSAGFTNLFTDNVIDIVVNATDNYSVESVSVLVFGKTVNLNLSLDGLYRGSVLAPSAESTYPADIMVRDVAGNLNSSRYNLTLLTGPDLEVNTSAILFDPLTPVTGQHLNISARIRNLGSAKVEFADVTFMANDTLIGSRKVNLTASPDVNFNWNTTGFAGNVTIGVRIERSSNYSETNYSNNFASKKIFIDGPDLTVTNIAFNPISPVYEGQVVTITATIVNLKPLDANNTRISFYENILNLSNRIDFKDVNVPASGSVNVSVNWQTAGLPGIQTVFVQANTNDLPAEVDRSNNNLSAQFETKKYIAEQIPDLIIFPPKPLAAVPGEKVRGMASNDFDQDNKTDFVAGTDLGKIILYRNNGVFYTNNNKTKNVNFTQFIIDNIGETAWGMTSGDIFGDNYPDLIVGTESGKVIFYNNSNGTFTNKLTLLDVGDQAYGLAVSDFNNDNKFDIVVSNKKGQVNLYLNNMTGNVLTNESMVFGRTLTTRNQPFGLTTGDFDLDGHSDVMVGDSDGQIERIVWEIDRYNGFLFADVGSYAHGLTAADVDYSGKLDLFSTSFDGKVRMFFSREGGLVADPLIIGNIPESYGITSGDYDSDNDIDVIIGSDNGNVTMLMNSLRILKSTTPSPSPPRREIETTTQIQNPWAREMIDLNLTESWKDNVSFVKGGEWVCLDDYCDTKFYGDIYLYQTPWDNSTYNVHYYINFSNKVGPVIKVLRIEYRYVPGYLDWIKTITYVDYSENAVLNNSSFELPKILSIFDNLDMLRLREGFKYKYKIIPDSVTNVSAITNVNYSLFGEFNTPNTGYLLSDDVTNLNNITANTKNINPSKIKTDRDYVDDLVIAPDFTPTNLIFQGYAYPPVPGMSITAVATIKNLNDIAIDNAKVMFLIDNIPAKFGCPGNCRNYTTFTIGAKGTATVYAYTNLPMSVGTSVNVTVVVNPYLDEIETNYENNNISNSISTLPPSDLRNGGVYFSNGSVFKNVFIEGEPIKIYTDISNIGTNKSFSEDVFFIGAEKIIYSAPCCGNITPVNRIVNCNAGDSNYDIGLCDGFIDRNGPYQYTSPGNIEPGASVSTNISNVLGDFKLRSHGVYNVTSIISNAGSLDENHANDANFSQLIVLPSQEDLQFYYPYCDLNSLEKIYFSNPDGNNITFNYG